MKKLALVHAFILGFTLLASMLNAQGQIPDILVVDTSGEEYQLPDLIEEDRNYVIVVSESWNGFFKNQLITWKDCFESWELDFNLEVLVLSADGTEPNDQQNLIDFFNANSLDYLLYFGETDTVTGELDVGAYPTNFLVDDQGFLVDTILGFKPCSEMNQIISDNYELISSVNENSEGVEVNILGFDSGILIERGVLPEEIIISIYSTDGRLLKVMNDKFTNTFIDLSEINGIHLIHVVGSNWQKSSMVQFH